MVRYFSLLATQGARAIDGGGGGGGGGGRVNDFRDKTPTQITDDNHDIILPHSYTYQNRDDNYYDDKDERWLVTIYTPNSIERSCSAGFAFLQKNTNSFYYIQ